MEVVVVKSGGGGCGGQAETGGDERGLKRNLEVGEIDKRLDHFYVCLLILFLSPRSPTYVHIILSKAFSVHLCQMYLYFL